MLSTILKSTTPKNISCLQLLVTVAWWSFILSVSNKEGIYEIIHAWHKVQETHLISLPLIVIYQMVKVFLFDNIFVSIYWDIYFVSVGYWGKHIFIFFSTRPSTHSFSHTQLWQTSDVAPFSLIPGISQLTMNTENHCPSQKEMFLWMNGVHGQTLKKQHAPLHIQHCKQFLFRHNNKKTVLQIMGKRSITYNFKAFLPAYIAFLFILFYG